MPKLLYSFTALLLISCSAQKPGFNTKNPLYHQLNQEADNQHTGFILKDLDNGNIVFEQDADKNFNITSNTKLFTLYAGLQVLKDSVPSFQYVISSDSLLLWPMADPTFLHSDFEQQPAFDFLKNSGKDIYLVNGRYRGSKFGKGWAWDNYNSNFQTEITDFPIYGNVISYCVDENGTSKLFPDLSAMYFAEVTSKASLKEVKRSFTSNNLYVPKQSVPGYNQKIPIFFNDNLKESLLTDTLLASGYATTSVSGISWIPVPSNAKILYNTLINDVYREMLKQDNHFIAEHLMLNYTAYSGKEMSFAEASNSAKKTFTDLKENSYYWADGSGLSPENLASPRTLVTILSQIRNKLNNDNLLFSLFSQGGKDGTLAHMFKNIPEVFVYAQAGSQSKGTYNISGYLIGKSGKKYAFSYLNNHLVKSEKAIKSDVERVLGYIYQHY